MRQCRVPFGGLTIQELPVIRIGSISQLVPIQKTPENHSEPHHDN